MADRKKGNTGAKSKSVQSTQQSPLEKILSKMQKDRIAQAKKGLKSIIADRIYHELLVIYNLLPTAEYIRSLKKQVDVKELSECSRDVVILKLGEVYGFLSSLERTLATVEAMLIGSIDSLKPKARKDSNGTE